MSKWILPVILVLGLISLPLAFENEAPFSQTSVSPQFPEGGSAAATPVETVAAGACCPDPSHSHTRLSPADSPGQRRLEDIPESPFRQQLEAARPAIREQALAHFNAFGMAIEDADSLHIGPDGSLYYACRAPAQLAEPVFLDEPEPAAAALLAEASVPVASPPVYHSKPGAPYVIYLDFNGATISGTAWNSGGNTLNAYVWSKDSDTTTFSDDEQNIIRRIWQRMSEDYAPFNINVTTDPAFDPDITDGLNNVGWVLFTRDEDTGGTAMPAKGAGGVAYVGVFGNSSYASYYSPAFVYADNLGPNIEHFMAEAGSHEMGHNMGLSHDGGTGTTYYSGHSAGSLRWGPIMGSSYNDDITTWSKGEYTGANQFQDDLAIIANRVGYRPDEAGSSLASAAGLVFIGDSVVDPLTRDFIGDDPNEGIIESPTDVDTWSFSTDAGSVSFTVETFVAEDTRFSEGPNLDIKLTLKDSLDNVIATSDPQTSVSATINAVVQAGTYSLSIEGTGYGDPLASPPTGYTDYGSLGMYFITGNTTQSNSLPIVIGQSPAVDDSLDQPLTSFNILFSETMNQESFSLSDIASFTGPSGSISPTGYNWISDTSLEIQFPEQSDNGQYVFILNPTIEDTDGAELDQDLDLIAGEPADDCYTGSFFIDIPSPAETWRIDYFDTASNAGDGADDNDFDKDGLPNVLERAFATDPTLAGSAYRPQQSVMEDLGLQYPAITYKRPAGGTGTTGVDYAIDGLTYTVEYNTDLASTWESGDITVVSIDPPVDGMETVTVRLNTDLATETRQFIRLSVVGSD
jgi:hypothetical protein